MSFQKVPSIKALELSLSMKDDNDDPSPVGMRMRAAYYLRYHYETINTKKQLSSEDEEMKGNIIQILCNNLCNKDHGSLLRHEIGFVLGQLRDKRACNTLIDILDTTTDCVIARHECAEALAAIGCKDSISILKKYSKVCIDIDNPIEISETCMIALKYLQWKLNNTNNNDNKRKNVDDDDDDDEYIVACPCMEQTSIVPSSPYLSVDPAPPHVDPKYVTLSNEDLGQLLLSTNTNLFDRYRVLFTLRNRAGDSDSGDQNTNTNDIKSAIQELNNVLLTDTSSALLRHELAYVLGQIQHPCSQDALITCLKNKNEHRMVRHEAAEALGAVMENYYKTDDENDRMLCLHILNEYKMDEELVVSESCIVALDAVDYWNTTS